MVVRGLHRVGIIWDSTNVADGVVSVVTPALVWTTPTCRRNSSRDFTVIEKSGITFQARRPRLSRLRT